MPKANPLTWLTSLTHLQRESRPPASKCSSFMVFVSLFKRLHSCLPRHRKVTTSRKPSSLFLSLTFNHPPSRFTGYLAPGGLWRGIAEDLASLGHTVLSYDHPGCGSSTFPTGVSRFTTTSFADHAYQLMDNVWGSLEAPGSAGPVHVVGQSMGSMIAQGMCKLSHHQHSHFGSLHLCHSHTFIHVNA